MNAESDNPFLASFFSFPFVINWSLTIALGSSFLYIYALLSGESEADMHDHWVLSFVLFTLVACTISGALSLPLLLVMIAYLSLVKTHARNARSLLWRMHVIHAGIGLLVLLVLLVTAEWSGEAIWALGIYAATSILIWSISHKRILRKIKALDPRA